MGLFNNILSSLYNNGYFVNSGAPHYVEFVDDLNKVDIIQDETNSNQTKIDLDFSLNYEPNRFESITLNFDATSESTTGTSSGGY